MKATKELLNNWINSISFIERAYDVPTLRVHNDNVFIREIGDVTHVAIAGSNGNRSDWIGSRGNLTITQDKIKDLNKTATRGFVNASLSCYNQIVSYAQQNKVCICGHSRGGPIASIVACLLHEKDNKEITLTTFGSPRFTHDESFNDYDFIKNSCRVVSNGDGITAIPDRLFFNRKWVDMIHLGNEFVIGEKKDRHAGRFFDYYDAHAISMYKSTCYDMLNK